MTTARSTPNIALIKYWGNRSNELRLPMADSLSMTLDRPCVDVTVGHRDTLRVESFLADGTRKELKEKDIARYGKAIELAKRYLSALGAADAIPASLAIEIRSQIPPSVGFASSAAVFSALARAIAGLIADEIPLTNAQTSVIARLGSGSACRGIGDGYVAIKAGGPGHWTLHDIIIVPNMEEKKVGSTEGHATAHTSPHYTARVAAIREHRQRDCIDAVIRRDFEKLQRVAEEDCLDMHRVMQTSTPPLQYLNDETYRIVGEVRSLREREHIPVLFTMDAGPTVHLFCPNEGVAAVRAYAHVQSNCAIFETKVGKGAHLVEEKEFAHHSA